MMENAVAESDKQLWKAIMYPCTGTIIYSTHSQHVRICCAKLYLYTYNLQNLIEVMMMVDWWSTESA